MNIKNILKNSIWEALKKLNYDFEFEDIIIDSSNNEKNGDYATNVAMKLTKILKKNPIEIAKTIKENIILEDNYISSIEIAGPGFINFFMDKRYLKDILLDIIKKDEAYGSSNIGNDKKVNIEFVSANPTGYLHIGHARGAAYGDSLARLMKKAGFDVTKEYYINDAGNQINNLALSVETRYKELLGQDVEMPEDGYYGPEIIEIAKQIKEKNDNDLEDGNEIFRKVALDHLLNGLKSDLSDFNVDFDIWFSEQSLYDDGVVEKTVNKLTEKGYTYTNDNATWLKTTEFFDEKDRVILKGDGTYTYLTPDIGYHANKISRGYDTIIDVLGADHHGYINRLKSSIAMLGFDPEKLKVKILQMVRVVQDGEEIKMSKRSGKAITLRDLVDAAGKDAIRYFFAMRSLDTQMDLDLNLAIKKTNENPVYYAQYAYVRANGVLNEAKKQNISLDYNIDNFNDELSYDLIDKLGHFKEVVENAALKEEPHLITNYISEIATLFHKYYSHQKVIDEDLERTMQRLAVVKALSVVMKSALELVGVSVPDKM